MGAQDVTRFPPIAGNTIANDYSLYVDYLQLGG